MKRKKISKLSKKGVEMLGEATGNIIIAVLCIIVLIFLGITVANIFLNNKSDLEKAKATLNNIMVAINSLEEGKSINLVVYNPKKYAIMTWLHVNQLPAGCINKDCICICDFTSYKFQKEIDMPDEARRNELSSILEKCNEPLGVCKPLNFNLDNQDFIWIYNPVDLKIELDKGFIKIDKV